MSDLARPNGQHPAAGQLAGRVRGQAATELSRMLGPARLFAPSADDEARVWAVISTQLAEAHREQVAQQVFDALLGLGPLERYLADDDVEEVLVNGHQRGFVVGAGGRKQPIGTGFGSEAELRAFASRTVAVAGRRLDEAHPRADARLPDGSRLHVICPPLAPYTCLTIRRHRLLAHSMADLLALGTLTPAVAAFLAAVVRAGLNLLISGGTAAGKTTALNAIASEITALDRVVTIEETRELALGRLLADCIPLEGRFANVEGLGEVRIRELVRDALRMRPQRIIVGEVRGAEALDMLNAMNSGHEGSMGTIHANSARQALSKLHTYTKMAEEALSDQVVTEMLAQTVDLVCQLRQLGDGRRVLTNELLRPGTDDSSAFTGVRPRAIDRLVGAGWDPMVMLGGQP